MLHDLPKLTKNQKKRLGRGVGSGVGGHTVGRGGKGHTAREGSNTPLWFEGGQLPLIKRLPYWRGKFHFKSLTTAAQEVDVASLEKLGGKDVTVENLFAAGLIRTQYAPAKIIGNTAKLTKVGEVRGVSMSVPAKKLIEAAGGIIKE